MVRFFYQGTQWAPVSWKIWCLSSPTFGMKNVPLKNLRTVFQVHVCCCQLVHGPLPRPALKYFWNNRCQESVPFVSKIIPSGPSRLSVHGLPPRPALTDFWNNRREESVPFVSKVHPGGPSRTSVHGPPPRPALTDFWNTRRKESVPFVSKVHPGGPSRPAVHGPPPRPALTDFWNNRREESVPFVSKVHPGGPSRPAVHGPLWQTSETLGVRNPCRLFQKSTPAARHGMSVHGPLWRTSETIGVRNPCRLFQKSIPAARHGQPSTARSDGLLKQSAWRIRAVCFKSPSQRPVTASRPRPTLTDFWNNRREESVPFVSKVHPGGPSRTSVTARSDELLKQTAPHKAAMMAGSPQS